MSRIPRPPPGMLTPSPNRMEDILQLRVVMHVVDTVLPEGIRPACVSAVERLITDKYPKRPNRRPRKDERNAWLGVIYAIGCAKAALLTRTSKFKESLSKDIADRCARLDIAISAAAIRRLPKLYPGSKRTADSLTALAAMFKKPHELACDIAWGFVERAEHAEK